MSDKQFNPNSYDAQFGRIIQHLETQDKALEAKKLEDREAFKAIMAKQDLTNGRVTKLEHKERYTAGKVAGIALLAGAIIPVAEFFFR